MAVKANHDISSGLDTAFINSAINSNLAYRPEFVSNDYTQGKKVSVAIERELRHCDAFYISVAFITEGGLAPLKQVLAELRDKGIPGKILTTSYLTFTEPKALKTLANLSNVEVRVYDSTDEGASGFHTKGYIFKEEEIYRFIVGSSNMTASAFSVNKEWNTKLVSTSDGELLKQMMTEYSHEAIIPKDEWQAVQMEFERRDAYKEEVGLHAFGNDSSPFSGRIICSHCGKPYRRCGWSRNGKKFWMCASKKAKDASSCQADNIFEESIFEAFRVAWNGVVANKDNLTEKWDDQIENGNPLERLRAKQMKMLIAEGPIQSVVQEHVILVLERIIAYDKRHFEVRFLDGTVKQICISE